MEDSLLFGLSLLFLLFVYLPRHFFIHSTGKTPICCITTIQPSYDMIGKCLEDVVPMETVEKEWNRRIAINLGFCNFQYYTGTCYTENPAWHRQWMSRCMQWGAPHCVGSKCHANMPRNFQITHTSDLKILKYISDNKWVGYLPTMTKQALGQRSNFPSSKIKNLHHVRPPDEIPSKK